MRLERISIAVLIGSCGFRITAETAPIDASSSDAADARTGCEPGEPVCAGRVLGTCNADGTGIDPGASTRDCTLACVDAPQPHCAAASNVPESAQATCIAAPGPALAPPAGATVTIGTGSITCAPHCGSAGMTTIARVGALVQSSGPPVSWYCLGGVTLLAGTTVTANLNVLDAIVWIATGPVVIDGVIDLDGTDGAQTSTGQAGPGGTDGGDLGVSNADGVPAPGACGGAGGKAGAGTSLNGGGGGGGGHRGGGGAGGDAMTVTVIAPGGAGGAGSCGAPALVPLTGGAGGGGGGDGSCGGTSRCGFPGGGGGGAIQISGRAGIAVNGTIHARGGTGHGDPGDPLFLHAGAGGGGAGGAILLESWEVRVGMSAVLDVGGGNGGASGTGTGGVGATTSSTGGDGPDATVGDVGGSGGGGGPGVVRINAPGASCIHAVPSALCTTGAPPPSPP